MAERAEITTCDFPLNRNHLSTLVEFLSHRVAAKWRRIGTALKFDQGVLNMITVDNQRGGTVDCFTNMLGDWLEWAPPTHYEPTLQRLCRALRSRNVGEPRLANELEKHMKDSVRADTAAHSLQDDPQDIHDNTLEEEHDDEVTVVEEEHAQVEMRTVNDNRVADLERQTNKMYSGVLCILFCGLIIFMALLVVFFIGKFFQIPSSKNPLPPALLVQVESCSTRIMECLNESNRVRLLTCLLEYLDSLAELYVVSKPVIMDTFELLESKNKLFDADYVPDKSTTDGYEILIFYSQLCKFYLNFADSERVRECHQTFLWRFYGLLKHCHPYCGYLDIHLTYVDLGEDDNAQQFLAFTENHTSIRNMFAKYDKLQKLESQALAHSLSEMHVYKVLLYLNYIQEGRLLRPFTEFFSAVDLFIEKGEMEHAKKVELMIADPTYSVYKHSRDIQWLIKTAHTCLEEGALTSASAVAEYVYTETRTTGKTETLLEAAYITGYAFHKAGKTNNAQKWFYITISLINQLPITKSSETQILTKHVLQYFDLVIDSKTFYVSARHFKSYVELIISVSKWETERTAIKSFKSRNKTIDIAFKQGLLYSSVYEEFYVQFCLHYENLEDEKGVRDCHQALLHKVHALLNDCYPHCDYLDIAVAYTTQGNRIYANCFLGLTLKHTVKSVGDFFVIYDTYMNLSFESRELKGPQRILNRTLSYLVSIQDTEIVQNFSVYFYAIRCFKERGKTKHAKQVELIITDTAYHTFTVTMDIQWLTETATVLIENHALLAASNVTQSVYNILTRRPTYTRQPRHSIHTVVLNVVHAFGTAFFKAGDKTNAEKWLQKTVQLIDQQIQTNTSDYLRDLRFEVCQPLYHIDPHCSFVVDAKGLYITIDYYLKQFLFFIFLRTDQADDNVTRIACFTSPSEFLEIVKNPPSFRNVLRLLPFSSFFHSLVPRLSPPRARNYCE